MDKIPELLAPAGDLEKLKIAVLYGADAVYAGLNELNLRAGATNFTREQFIKGIEFAHKRSVRVYATVNIFAHNYHLEKAPSVFKFLSDCGVDAIIVSDPGIAKLAGKWAPEIPLHLSTQAGVTNWESAKFWFQQGIKRINLARELTLKEINQISNILPDVELETFVHGAMCLAYSGRCLLSAYLTGRGANKGECTHPCRWKYLVEEYRPEEPLILEEDFKGSHILSSRDLCMLDHLPDLINTGVQGLKIEGRMKTIHYVATVTKVYRQALDNYKRVPENYLVNKTWKEEIYKITHRHYSTGFFYGDPLQVPKDEDSYKKRCTLAGLVLDYDPIRGYVLVEQRNHFKKGDYLEVLSPLQDPYYLRVDKIYNLEGVEITRAPHPQQHLKLLVNQTLNKFDLLRKYV